MDQNKEPLHTQANTGQEATASEESTKSQPWRETVVQFWHQLRWNLILSFILLAVLPLTIGVAITLNRVRTQAVDQVSNELTAVTELKRDQIERWLEDSRSVLDLFMANPTLRDSIPFVVATLSDSELTHDSLNSLLYEAVNAQSLFEEFFIYNTDGRIVASSNPDEIGKVTENKPYFTNSLFGEFMQPPYYELSAEGGKLTMVMTRPLIDEQRAQIVGNLTGRLDLSTLGQIMTERTGLHESDETYLVSLENNYLLTPSRAEGYPLTRAYHSEGIDQVLLAMDGSGVYDNYLDSPVTVIGVYRWVPELQAGLVAEVTEAEALTTFVQARNGSVIVAALAALAAIAVGFYTATRISSPIIRLTQVATRIAGGDLSQRAEIKQSNEIGLLAAVFNHMATQLQALIDSLEERVAARTERLEIVANLSERLSAILDLEDLLAEIVNQVKESFDYYHAHIYLLDDRRENLVVAEGTGEAGAEMKSKGHRIPLNAPTSLVARAGRTGEVVTVDNVREAPDWLPNPLLPNTYSEMAVPIIVDEQVVGVLDVQDDEIAGLDEGDANLLRSLANQIAVTIRNARLFEQTQSALAEAHAAHERYLEQSWRQAEIKSQQGQYRYSRSDAPILDETALTKAKQLALTQSQVAIVTLNDNDSGLESNQEEPNKTENPKSIVAPITLQDRIIGTLQLHPAIRNQTWTEDDLAIVEAVADQLAQSAENLRLFEETRERASLEQTIREITDKLQAAPNLDTLLETAARELGQRLGVRHTVLELGIEAERRSDGNKENGQHGNGEELA